MGLAVGSGISKPVGCALRLGWRVGRELGCGVGANDTVGLRLGTGVGGSVSQSNWPGNGWLAGAVS